MEKTVELLMKNASLLDVELVTGALKQQGIPHFINYKGKRAGQGILQRRNYGG